MNQDVPQKVRDLMKQTFGAQFNRYFLGLPTDPPPEAAFPCITIYKKVGEVSLGATGTDNNNEEIYIIVTFNDKDDLNDPNSEENDVTMERLRQLVEGKSSTGEWADHTILNALRTHFTLDEVVLASKVTIEYFPTPRPDATTLTEAQITITTGSIVLVPERS